MKYLFLGFNIFCRSIILNLILTIQLIIALILINLTIGHVNSYYHRLSLFETLANERGAYFMPSVEYLFHEGAADDVMSRNPVFNELIGVKSVSVIYQYAFFKEGILFEAVAYDSFTKHKVKLPLAKGTWFGKDSSLENYVPAVVSSESHGFELNKIVPVHLLTESGEQEETYIKVIGVLRNPPFVLSYRSGGNAITGNEIFSLYDEGYQGYPGLILDWDALGQHKDSFYNQNVNCMVFFAEDISQGDYTSNIEKLSNHGYVRTIEAMHHDAKQEAGNDVRAMMPFIISSLAIACIGLISLNILNTILHIKVFAIFYLCGCRWNNTFYICLSYMLIVCSIAYLLLLMVWYWAASTGVITGLGLVVSTANYAATFGVIAIVLFLSLLIPYTILKRTYPIEILR